MKPFRKHVALAIDGGGIKGVIASRAIAVLEEHLQVPAYEVFGLLAGTSTGSIITAGIATGLFGEEIHSLYCQFGPVIFKKTMRSALWPLTRYRYPLEPLQEALEDQMGGKTMGEFWVDENPIDLVITAFDLVENKTLFIKPFKEFAGEDPWPVTKAVLASSSVPSYFPPVENRYVDGGVGSYHNPCYVAAYEAKFVLGWDPAETTLISLGGMVGIGIAGRHSWLQTLPPDQVPDCGQGLNYMIDTLPFTDVLSQVLRGSGECATIDWTFLGLSMPNWTLVWYIGITLVTIVVTIRANKRQAYV